MKKWLAVLAIGVTSIGAFAEWWRRHPRFGARTVNRVVNPWLIREGIGSMSRGEIGLLEHVGRATGIVRVSPIHPVRTSDGFRVIVPLGGESQWAQNVLAAGHCRLEIDGVVHELDEPRLVEPTEVTTIPSTAANVMAWFGFRYLLLHQFRETEGSLEALPREAAPAALRARSHRRHRAPVEAAEAATIQAEAVATA